MRSAALKINERLSLEPLTPNYFENSVPCVMIMLLIKSNYPVKTPYAWQLWFDDQTLQGHSHYVIYDQSQVYSVLRVLNIANCVIYFTFGLDVMCVVRV